MSEKETSPKERKVTIMLLPVVAVIAFLLGAVVFSVVNKKENRADGPEALPSAEADAGEGWLPQEGASMAESAGQADLAPASGEAGSVADAELEALAEKYNISVGKASLIQEVIAQKPGLAFESLVPMTISEIAQIISEENSSGGAPALADGAKEDLVSDSPDSQAGGNAAPGIPASQAGGNMASGASSQAGTGSSAYIGEAAAKEAALADAGVKESDTAYMSCYVDYDDGRAEHYKVEFVIGNTEYEYEIDLYSGGVLEKSTDTYNAYHSHYGAAGTENSAGSYIGEEAAWAAALSHAGLKESEVTKKKVKLDEENGIMVYEVEFEKGRIEYDYEIHAVSGEILKAETDRD